MKKDKPEIIGGSGGIGAGFERDLSVIKSRPNGAPVSLLGELANYPEVLCIAPESSLHAQFDLACAGLAAGRSL